MPERVLVSTFGFDEAKVLSALRSIPYERLAILAGGKSLKEAGLRRLQSAERAAGGSLEVVEAYHCEDRPVRLPVLRGVSFTDRLNPAERAVLGCLDRPRPVRKIV